MKKFSIRNSAIALVLFSAATACLAQTTPTGTLTDFASQPASYGGTLNQGLIQASDGNFYASPYDSSYIFRITLAASPAGTVSSLKGQISAACGDNIVGGVIEGPDGDLYAISSTGGTNSDGVFFSYSLATKSCTALYNFGSADGSAPSPLTLGADGNFYGTFRTGGANNYGDVFRITPAGAFKDLYDFTGGTDGGYPQGTVLQASDGNFYGQTDVGVSGSNNGGPFQLIPGATTPWVENVLLSFSSATGYYPTFGISEWTDGNLYAPLDGGGSGYGTIWESDLQDNNPNADFFNFPGPNSQPQSTLFLAGDGQFYSAQSNTAGPNDGGFYIFNPGTKAFTSLANFVPGNTAVTPVGPVIQATDGNFYGTAESGGTNNTGAYYEVAVSPAVPTTITVTPSATSTSGSPITLTWKVTEVTSNTAAQCYAYPYQVSGGFNVATTTAGNWGGKLSSSITNFAMSGSVSVSPTAIGSYVYAVECQGKIAGLSPVVTVTGLGATPTRTTLSVTANPVSYGSTETFNVTVAPTSGTGIPQGQVAFRVGTTTLFTKTLNAGGQASQTVNATGYGAGNYPVIAYYLGSSANSASTSNTVNVQLVYPTSTTLTVTPTSVTRPNDVTVSAAVAITDGSTATPTGSVKFYAGGQYLTSVNVNSSGVASFTAATGSYPAGSYSVTAVYQGGSGTGSSTSNAVSVTLH